MLTVTLALVPYHPGHKSKSRLALISNPSRNTVEVISFTEHSCPHGSLAFPYAVSWDLRNQRAKK